MCGGRDERDGDAAAEAAAAVVAAVEIEYGSWGAHNEVTTISSRRSYGAGSESHDPDFMPPCAPENATATSPRA